MQNKFDRLQKEFFELYNKIYNEELILKINDKGDRSLWSAPQMFDLIPLKIERSWGNLAYEDILEKRPNTKEIITEAVYHKDDLICAKYWRGENLIGFVNYIKLNFNTIKETRVTVDDDEQELVTIGYFTFGDNKSIKESFYAHLTGVKQEEYIYQDDKIFKIVINEKTSIDYIYELPNGIIDKPITTETMRVEYKNEQVLALYNGKGENMYVKK